MPITTFMYGAYPDHLSAKRVDWVADDIRLALLDDTHVPDQDAHDYWDDVLAEEVSGTNYPAGGFALASKAVSYVAASNRRVFSADNLSVATVTASWRYGVLYDRTPATDATRPLIGYLDFGTLQSLVAQTFALDWHASNGVVSFVVT